MNETDMSKLMNQFSEMLKKGELPNDLQNIVNSAKNSSNSSSSEDSTPEIDINTILKMKQILDSMNSNKDNPRSNLLMSLKPYLRESKKEKVDQYVKLFSLGKAFEAFNVLGGEKKNDV